MRRAILFDWWGTLIPGKSGVPQTMDPEVVALLREAREGGLRFAIVTNQTKTGATATVLRTLGKYDAGDLFDFVLASADLLIHKPDPRIFRMALAGLGVSPCEAVFVGDTPGTDGGCEAVGLRYVLCDRATGVSADELKALLK
ncbi:HAD family hydrolase [Alienimonas sp. DA493]|uniref:HAD family hydrolase n=1 Tax=Alienimonas sp. DA493 TaxID=3373605 RepID=UPI00375502EC